MLRHLIFLFALLTPVFPASAQSAEADLILAHDSGVVTAAFSDDDRQILSATESGQLLIWSVADGALQRTIQHGDSPLTHAFWLDDATILSADESGLVQMSDAAAGESRPQWRMAGKPVALQVNAAGEQALVFTDEGFGALLSLADGDTLAEISLDAEISGASLNADGTVARAWSESGSVYSWNLQTGEVTDSRPPQRGLLGGLAWNADDSRALAWFSNGQVHVYESDAQGIGGGRVSGMRHTSFVQQAIWSRDETRVMSWAGDDTVHIWDAATGRAQQVLRHEDWVIGARWDADETTVLSWSHIYVYLWQGETVQRFRHGNLVRGASWNSDGTRILSWSWDKTARLWTP